MKTLLGITLALIAIFSITSLSRGGDGTAGGVNLPNDYRAANFSCW